MKISKRIRWTALALGGAAVLSAITVSAQDGVMLSGTSALPSNAVSAPPSSDDYQALMRRLQVAEARLDTLAEQRPNEVFQLQGQYTAEFTPEVAPQAPPPYLPEVSAAKADPAAGFPSVKVSGFFHLDTGYFSQDANSRATLGDIQDGTGFRRTRLQALGKVAEFTNYSIEMDFATAGRPSFMDVWGEQTHLPYLGNLRIGHFRQPTSMDGLTSIRQLDFLERSLPFQAFDPFRRTGIMAYDKLDNEMTTWAYSVYRTGAFNNAPVGDTRYGTDIGDNGGYSVAVRGTHLLYYDEPADGRYLMHIGGSYDYSRITQNGPNGGFYEARVIPEFFVGDSSSPLFPQTVSGTPFFADTGRLPADSFQFYTLQWAGQYGAAHFQSEYMGTYVNQIAGPSVYYDGAYAQVGYFLTGEHRTYNRSFGTFDKVIPFTEFFALGRQSSVCGWGAWEAVARWSYVNLDNPLALANVPTATIPVSPNPGSMTNLTVGFNWVWNPYTNLQVNYIHAFLDSAITGDSDTDIYAARFQIQF